MRRLLAQYDTHRKITQPSATAHINVVYVHKVTHIILNMIQYKPHKHLDNFVTAFLLSVKSEQMVFFASFAQSVLSAHGGGADFRRGVCVCVNVQEKGKSYIFQPQGFSLMSCVQ